MITVKAITVNPFQENTYVLYDETGECLIIDPGIYTGTEQNMLVDFISQNKLRPVKLLLTHAHIDHILGNRFVFDQYGLSPELHKGEESILDYAPTVAAKYGFQYDVSPKVGTYLEDNQKIGFGNSELLTILAPGHSPAHICFYTAKEGILIGGDVLFYNSIGRTDLPGGDHDTLIKSINERLFVLPDETVVYPGHGPETNIGFEKKTNPFLTA
ncbi:MAG: MBL fold metallo-hydrolase [Mucilaginibacter polytrichastri]|nr:MBL fold metallo-hydrolase [Mucilaginibacter polytrichastri]